MQDQHSFPKNKIHILLLENVHASASESFKEDGFQVTQHSGSMSEEELLEKIAGYHMIGIRSKTKLTRTVLQKAKKLLAIGCFCIGTDQVDLVAAEELGIPVFNSPFCNSRSVAELIVAEVISLSRQLSDRSSEMHNQKWNKVSKGCFEVRGKKLGIIGYGHIGTQLSVLAESLGLKVLFYDINDKLALGRSKAQKSMDDLLAKSDFVTLHVPDTEFTRNMISAEQIQKMKKGSYLLNASRGKVVDIPALADALKTGYLAGAAVDVYPSEPSSNGSGWQSELQGCPNTILTPHIGGSTEEAQAAIGGDVSNRLMLFINSGKSVGAVNFPNAELPEKNERHRILYIHKNQPGAMRDVNTVLEITNISGQVLATTADIGYLIVDVDEAMSHEVKKRISSLPSHIKTRVLY